MKNGIEFHNGGLENVADLCEVCALLLTRKQKQWQLFIGC